MLYFYSIFCFLRLNQMLSPPKNPPNQIQKDQSASFLSTCLHGNIYPIIVSFAPWQYLTQLEKSSLMASNTSLLLWAGVRIALLPGCLCLVHSAVLWDRDCPGRGGTGFPAATSWSMAVLSLDSGLVMSFVRVMQAGADTSPESLSPVRGLGEGHSAVLFSPSVLQAFAHSWGVHRAPVCEDQGSVCALLGAWWGRMGGWLLQSRQACPG